ncbi:MAG: UDP-glucose 4-epimerase GalE [Clostridia bacterium]|nr:UDP-glucose 4-epimerase GalE [Clostridia bacterium]
MKVLLTGGAGFIGSHTCVELVSKDFDAVIVDNFSNSDPGVIERCEKITGRKIKYHDADVADKAAMRRIFAEEKFDAVIHFAGYKAVGESVAKPLMYYRNNLDTTLTLLEVMKEYGVDIFVFSSSATVYGDKNPVPFTEDMPTSTTNPYGTTKLFIEKILTDAAAADKDLSVVLLRYFNPIGAHESGLIGENPKGIPNNLMPYIAQVASGIRDKLHVFGNDFNTHDGTGVRDYIHVTDLAKGHVKALEYAADKTGCEIFNLGTGTGYSVLDIVNAFEKATGINIPYVIDGRRAGDIDESRADASKAERVLGWKAEKTLLDMCADTWNWQKNIK